MKNKKQDQTKITNFPKDISDALALAIMWDKVDQSTTLRIMEILRI